MAQPGPVFSSLELDALSDYVQLFLHVAEDGRVTTFDGIAPHDRWKKYPTVRAAQNLLPRVRSMLERYAWHRTGAPAPADAIATSVVESLAERDIVISQAHAHGVLLAGAYFLEAPKYQILSDDEGLSAIEHFSAFVNGFVQTLPPRFAPKEREDSRNRRFRSYQRRRYGADITVIPPHKMVGQMPASVHQLLDIYQEQLVAGSLEGIELLTGNLAIALCRPVDAIAVAQLELALATALVWRDISGFPATNNSHPLLGVRPEGEGGTIWDLAGSRITASLRVFAARDDSDMDPTFVQTPAHSTVSDVELDAESLNALSLLDDYVAAFTAWMKMGVAAEIPVEQRVAAFDHGYRGTMNRELTGASITAQLPGGAMKIISNVDVMLTRKRDITPIAQETAAALGDRSAISRLRRTLETAAAWMRGEISLLEQADSTESQKPAAAQGAKTAVIELRDDASVIPFKEASPRDAESLLDFGASIVELVRFSQALNGGSRPPEGWWVSFHTTGAERPLTQQGMLTNLAEGAWMLLKDYAGVLAAEKSKDFGAAPRALASALNRESEDHCVRTLAVALSTGVIWAQAQRISRDRVADTLFGAEPTLPSDRLLCARADAQLQWGLQELLQTDSVPGV